jgi:hypothetical protein
VALTAWAGRAFAVAACLWFGTGALRDQNAQLGAVLRSKPVDGARWVLVTWGTGVGLWLLLLACVFVGAMLGQLPASGLTSVAAHGLAFLRASLIMVPLATLGFALSRITRSPLGATVIVLAFLCVLGGLQFMPQFLRPDYTQNLVLYVGAAAAALALAGFLVERARRGELRRPVAPAIGLAACLAVAGAGAAGAHRAAQPVADGGVADLMNSQHLEPGRQIPGFWLPDGRGGTVRSADYAGKILLLYLFTPQDGEAARTLPALDAVGREFAAQGVQPLGLCFAQDRGEGTALALTGGLGFPLGIDSTTIKTSTPPDGGLLGAFNVKALPVLIVTDRRRQARTILEEPSYTPERLRVLVTERLAEEPE